MRTARPATSNIWPPSKTAESRETSTSSIRPPEARQSRHYRAAPQRDMRGKLCMATDEDWLIKPESIHDEDFQAHRIRMHLVRAGGMPVVRRGRRTRGGVGATVAG